MEPRIPAGLDLSGTVGPSSYGDGMAPRPTKRRVPPPGQLRLPLRVPGLINGPMLELELDLDEGRELDDERAYRWRPGDPVPLT